MDTPTVPPPPLRLRSWHVFLALVSLVVVLALGSQLPRTTSPGLIGASEMRGPDAAEIGLALEGSLVNGAAAPLARSAQAALLGPADGTATDEAAAIPAEGATAADDALIVRTASLELEVQDVAATLQEARTEMAALGGYVSGSDAWDQGESRWASVTYRVPVERFSEAIDALRGLAARVVRESTQSVEVTGTVMDLDARITNLRASEAALAEIMQRAGRIEDVLSVQMRLEEVRGQIEQLDAQRSHLADQAALSTLTVSWYTPVPAVTAAQQGWDLGSEVDEALAQTVEALQAAIGLGVWFVVVAVPLLGLPLLLLTLLLVLVRRRAHAGAAGGPNVAGSAAGD
jgi:hypothetical protein